MAKIPFDIKFRPQIESGEYRVETRDGRLARIICWDKIDDDYPLVALVCSYDDRVAEEAVQEYTLRGEYHASNRGEITTSSIFDLFLIIPDQELSEFEEATLKAYDKMCAGEKHLTPRTNHIQEAAAELLALARKEIERDLQKEQKSEKINITEMVSKYRNTDEYYDDGNYKGKPVNCMIRAYEQGIRDTLLKVKEQKPAEWSEDIRNWKNIAYYVLKEWIGIGQYLDNPALDKIAEELQKRYNEHSTSI